MIFLKFGGSRYRLISETKQRAVVEMFEVDSYTLTCRKCGTDLQPAVHRFASFKDLLKLKCFECGMDVTGDEMLKLFDSLEYQLRQYRPGGIGTSCITATCINPRLSELMDHGRLSQQDRPIVVTPVSSKPQAST